MPEAPHFSLVVCTLARREPLVRLLDSLRLQGDDDFEIVLVDQNPEGFLDDLIGAYEGALNISRVRSEKGLSRARNVGLSVARGAIVAFPDDDCWYPQGILSDVRSWMNGHPDVGVLTCVTRDACGVLSNGRFLKTSRDVSRRNVWYAGNSNGLFFRREVIAQTGLFDETLGTGSGSPFGAGEETDYLLRALATGARIRFERNLFVHHDQVISKLDAAEMARARLYARGFGRVMRLHGYSSVYAVYRALRTLAAAVKAALIGHLHFARFKLVWVVGTLAGYFAPLPVQKKG